MAYLAQVDLEHRMTAQRVLALYDDENTGTVNAAALAAVLQEASNLVDGHIARSYTGTFPMPSPPPVLCKSAATLYAIAMSVERDHAYVAKYGEKHTLDMRKEAEKMCEKIAAGLLKLVDAPPPTAGTTLTGGLVISSGPQLTAVDGVSNTGDY